MIPALALLPALEAGIGIGGFLRGRLVHKNKLNMLRGTKGRSIALVDATLQKQTMHATRTQRVVAKRATDLVRGVVHTEAFHLSVLMMLQQKWPGKRTIQPIKLLV